MPPVFSFPAQREMDNAEEHVVGDNLESDTSMISRVVNLRRVLRELRNSLRDERLNLHREIEITILQKFVELQRNCESLTDHASGNFWLGGDAWIPGGGLKLHGVVYSNGDTSKTNYLTCLGSSMYQRTIDELQDELNSFERRLSTATSGSYRRKIYDLEAICCADLNRVRSRFVKSLQAFENTIDSIEELYPWRIKDPACRCATKKPPIENNTDAFRHERPTSRNAEYDRSLPRSKSIAIDEDRSSPWWMRVCSHRHSDSGMYNDTSKSSSCFEDSQIPSFNNSVDNLKMSKSFTVIFPRAFGISRTLL